MIRILNIHREGFTNHKVFLIHGINKRRTGRIRFSQVRSIETHCYSHYILYRGKRKNASFFIWKRTFLVN